MSLQQKFLLIVLMLGLAVLGSLGAAWIATSLFQRELATPFAATTGVLDALGHIKRHAEDLASKVNTGARLLEPDQQPQAPHGVRGPRFSHAGRPLPDADLADMQRINSDIGRLVAEIDANDALTARIGISTWRNLKDRLASIERLIVAWSAASEPPAQQAAADSLADSLFSLHELIEHTELQILSGAGHAVDNGERIRWLLRAWLLSVLGVSLLGGVLALTLLRRWVQVPVRSLREAAARIAQGDFQHRVPVLQRDELGRLSAEINHMTEMVQVLQDERVERERLAAVGGMLRRIIHNVRNPLAGIRGLAEVTRLDFDKTSPTRENMDLIVSTVDTFERWLSELLDASSPAHIELRDNAVQPWVSGIVEIHRPQAQARGVTLQLDSAGAPTTAAFDPKHLDHAVSALLSNAIEAVPDGGSVWITARSAGPDQWEVIVTDSGAGVPADVLPRIFEPQFTTKRHGSGLGLAMAQQIVRGHLGKLAVRNTDPAHPERSGASFTIRLPIRGGAT